MLACLLTTPMYTEINVSIANNTDDDDPVSGNAIALRPLPLPVRFINHKRPHPITELLPRRRSPGLARPRSHNNSSVAPFKRYSLLLQNRVIANNEK